MWFRQCDASLCEQVGEAESERALDLLPGWEQRPITPAGRFKADLCPEHSKVETKDLRLRPRRRTR